MQQRICAAFAFAAVMLFAAAPASADDKIAVVRFGDLVQNSPQYKGAAVKMKGEFDKRKDELDAQGKQFSEDAQKFQRDADTMTPDQRAKMAKDLDSRKVDLGYAQQKFQEDLQARDHELFQGVMSKIKDVIYQVAKEKGYDLVIQDPVYSTPTIDITDEVLKRLTAQAAPAK
ncbi:MAG: OmpH family outer membrane protein [Nevskia sp.]|nr:OmpH family outer membrane protein [Nevskia sp.]